MHDVRRLKVLHVYKGSLTNGARIKVELARPQCPEGKLSINVSRGAFGVLLLNRSREPYGASPFFTEAAVDAMIRAGLISSSRAPALLEK
jgi:hypothetical protein